jgi:membrane protease YdiL (CAAX protease family)
VSDSTVPHARHLTYVESREDSRTFTDAQATLRDSRKSEIAIVLLLSLGASAAYAILSLFRSPVRGGRTVLSHPPVRLVDLAQQILATFLAVVPVLLVGHLLRQGGESWQDLRLTVDGRRQSINDLATGTVIAIVVGTIGLAFYICAVRLGVNRTVIPVVGNGPWWSLPMSVAHAAQNAIVEETIVLGYLLHRLRQIDWTDRSALVASALLRGSYHLYQGYGAFAANFLMGITFGLWWQKGRRTTPLVVAHFVIDAAVFVGYPLVRARWTWIPH